MSIQVNPQTINQKANHQTLSPALSCYGLEHCSDNKDFPLASYDDFDPHVSKKESLGIYAKFSATPENTGLQTNDKSRYRLLKQARKSLKQYAKKKHRITQCHHNFIPDANPTLQVTDTARGYSWGNVVKCGNPSCPVCSVSVAHEIRAELAQAVTNAKAQGLKTVLLTLTCQHDARHSADDNVKAMTCAWNKFRGHRTYKRLFDDNGVVDYIRVAEPTFNPVNGTHHHFHILLFIEEDCFNPDLWQNNEDDRSSLWWAIVRHWDAQLEKLDRTCVPHYALDIQQADEYIAEYISKIGHAPQNSEWDVTAEMSLSPLKRSKDDHYTTYQLLILADKGDQWASRMFAQYCDAMKGRSKIQWSKGLKDKLLNDDTPAVEAPAVESAPVFPQFETTRQAWRFIRNHRNRRADLMVQANEGDYIGVATELAKFHVKGVFYDLCRWQEIVPSDGWQEVITGRYDLDDTITLGHVLVIKGKVMDVELSQTLTSPCYGKLDWRPLHEDSIGLPAEDSKGVSDDMPIHQFDRVDSNRGRRAIDVRRHKQLKLIEEGR